MGRVGEAEGLSRARGWAPSCSWSKHSHLWSLPEGPSLDAPTLRRPLPGDTAPQPGQSSRLEVGLLSGPESEGHDSSADLRGLLRRLCGGQAVPVITQ